MNAVLKTERLILREWRASDRDGFAELNADPRVAECLPGVLTREESDASADRIAAHFAQHGYGLWVVEVPGEMEFAGFVGLWNTQFEAHFTPSVEVGWRIAHACWGRGYAPEGARAALQYGFETLGLEQILAITVPHNLRSRRVMEKIGMTRDEHGDFDHPMLPPGHPLQRHVLYRKRRHEPY